MSDFTSAVCCVAGLLLLAACQTTPTAAQLERGYVTDFASCVAAGHPVVQDYPRRCLHNGQYFVEDS